MSECLLALGSNLGERAATLDSAVAMLEALEGVRVVRHSAWQMTLPVGGEHLEREFLNGAAVVETTRGPEDLLAILQQIEASHGRERRERWGDRTLDLDLLLHGDRIVESPQLTLPHPRMSYRRFVLEPAVEIAGDWVHPTIGWTLAELVGHLDTGADCLAIVSPDGAVRHDQSDQLAAASLLVPVEPTTVDAKWPTAWTTWLQPATASATGDNAVPKLSILLDPPGESDAAWDSVARAPGRGPTLRLASEPQKLIADEVFAAISSVWPRLGSRHP